MLKPATNDDIPAVVRLMNEAYRGQGAVRSWNNEAGVISGARTSEAALYNEIAQKPDGQMLIWKRDGELQGCVWVEPMEGTTWYLGSLAVQPTLQKDGLGRSILNNAESWIAERGGTCVQITVLNVRDTLLAWYGRRGYRETGAVMPFPYGDGRVGTALRDDLAFLVLEKRIA